MTYEDWVHRIVQMHGFDPALMDAICENSLKKEIDEDFAEMSLFCLANCCNTMSERREYDTTGTD